MRGKLIKSICILLLLLTAAWANYGYHQDRVLIYLDNSQPLLTIARNGDTVTTGNTELDELLKASGAENIRRWLPSAYPTDHSDAIYLNRYFVVEFGAIREDINALRNIFEASTVTSSVELMPVLRYSYEPDDYYFINQWALFNVVAPDAWDIWNIVGGEIPGTGDSVDIKVGIVDTGVEWDHPDLVDNIWQNLGEDANGNGITLLEPYPGQFWFDPGDDNDVDDDGNGYVDDLIGWDTAEDDNNPGPNNVGDAPWHGTGVAGCVAGITNNSIGVASVGWGLTLIPVKIANDTDGSLTGAYDGILYAAHAGADVINCSWGGFGSGGAQSVINVAYNDYDAIVVASSGNGNEDTGYMNLDTHYPSGYNYVISVTATGRGDSFNCWATGGTTVDLGAPGESVLTTYTNDGYASVSGTSFSSPIVAGAVGLLWSANPGQSKEWIIDRIISTSDTYADMDRNCTVYNYDDAAPHSESMTGMLGSGRLNVFKALAGNVYPSLGVQEANITGDDDGDGVFNPGETINLKPVIFNEEGWATATGVIAILSSADERIAIPDALIEYTSDIPAGESKIELFDSFQLTATAAAGVGAVELTVMLYASVNGEYYIMEDDITVELSLYQANFPFEISASVESSPLAYDEDGDGLFNICFGSANFNFYSVGSAGEIADGFPYVTGNQIGGSPAIADLTGDGDLELVFGSRDKILYVLNTDGTVELADTLTGEVFGTVALSDLDGDEDYELVFGTTDVVTTGTTGFVHAIHHNGRVVEGYPIEVGEIIMKAPAVADIDNDGVKEVVVGTWSNNIYVVSGPDSIVTGFPFGTGGRINIPPVLADLTADGNLEIVAGSDDGSVYIITSDGSLVQQISTGGYVRGGFCLQDVNSDTCPEIFWGGYDKKYHAWDFRAGMELAGWPLAMGYNIESAPVLADIDGDDELELIGAHGGGDVVAYDLDGTMVDNFPVRINGSVESSPAVQDIDSDGDFDIMIGTTLGVDIIDYKQAAGSQVSWKVYQGSYLRSGYYADSRIPLAVRPAGELLPEKFNVSPNYPNPFNPSTTFEIRLAKQDFISVAVYNIIGQQVTSLMRGNYTPGVYSLIWNGRDQFNRNVPSGIYLLQVRAGNQVVTRKMALVK